jgi:hypothetical protein
LSSMILGEWSKAVCVASLLVATATRRGRAFLSLMPHFLYRSRSILTLQTGPVSS